MDTGPDSRRQRLTNWQDTWSARCGESRTPGAAGGPGKPTRSDPGRAPRSDPTASEESSWRRGDRAGVHGVLDDPHGDRRPVGLAPRVQQGQVAAVGQHRDRGQLERGRGPPQDVRPGGQHVAGQGVAQAAPDRRLRAARRRPRPGRPSRPSRRRRAGRPSVRTGSDPARSPPAGTGSRDPRWPAARCSPAPPSRGLSRPDDDAAADQDHDLGHPQPGQQADDEGASAATIATTKRLLSAWLRSSADIVVSPTRAEESSDRPSAQSAGSCHAPPRAGARRPPSSPRCLLHTGAPGSHHRARMPRRRADHDGFAVLSPTTRLRSIGSQILRRLGHPHAAPQHPLRGWTGTHHPQRRSRHAGCAGYAGPPRESCRLFPNAPLTVVTTASPRRPPDHLGSLRRPGCHCHRYSMISGDVRWTAPTGHGFAAAALSLARAG